MQAQKSVPGGPTAGTLLADRLRALRALIPEGQIDQATTGLRTNLEALIVSLSQQGQTDNIRRLLRSKHGAGVAILMDCTFSKLGFGKGDNPEPQLKSSLDIDVRGRSYIVNDVHVLEVGEIKSSTSAYVYALKQLLERLYVCAFVVSCVKPTHRCQLIGRIFVPHNSDRAIVADCNANIPWRIEQFQAYVKPEVKAVVIGVPIVSLVAV